MNQNSKEKVVVIGGGIAGLTAGIYALKSGFDAEIYEKNAIAGGECIGWNRKGYHIDNCIHWLTGTKKGTQMYDLWKTVGALTDDTEYAKIDSFYISTHEGKSVTLWNDLERTRKELIAAAPEDEEEINKFIQYTEYSKQCLFPAAKPMEMWGIKDYIAMGRDMGDMGKVMKEFGKISLHEYSKRFKSPLLRKMIVDYLPGEYTAYSLLVSYATMADGNGNIPMGASLQMTLRIVKKFEELGGKIYYNSGVDHIVLGNKCAEGIELTDGRVISADYVIPTVDSYVMFNKFIPKEYMPKGYKVAYSNPKDYPAMSGFQIAYAVSTSYDRGETVFVDIDPLKVGSRTFNRMYVKAYGYDPVFVKDGKQVIQMDINQTDADYEFWKGLSEEEYKAEKERLVAEVSRRIVENFPELDGDLEFLDCWTPLTYERYCGAYRGSYMSFVATPSAQRINFDGRIKGIKNLYMAGQWTGSTGGLPVAAASGKFAIQRLLKDNKRDINI